MVNLITCFSDASDYISFQNAVGIDFITENVCNVMKKHLDDSCIEEINRVISLKQKIVNEFSEIKEEQRTLQDMYDEIGTTYEEASRYFDDIIADIYNNEVLIYNDQIDTIIDKFKKLKVNYLLWLEYSDLYRRFPEVFEFFEKCKEIKNDK